MTDTEPSLEIFVDLFNVVYPEWSVYGNPNTELQPKNVDFDTNLKSYNARCAPRTAGKVYYRLNAEKWDTWDWPRRLQLIIHELSHIKHTDHSPDFWEQTVDNYHTLKQNNEEVTEIINSDVNWDAVAEHLVTNPTNNMVDNRVETAYERQLKLADDVGYPKDDIPPFNGVTIYIMHRMNDYDDISLSPEKIIYDDYDEEELINFFHTRPRSGLTYERGIYRIEPPRVKSTTDDEYEVIEGDWRAALIRQAIIDPSDSRTNIPVEIVD